MNVLTYTCTLSKGQVLSAGEEQYQMHIGRLTLTHAAGADFSNKM